MRLLLCWADISGYMAACWRALAAEEGIDLRIVAWEAGQKTFANDLVRGLNCRLLTAEEKNDAGLIRSLVKFIFPVVGNMLPSASFSLTSNATLPLLARLPGTLMRPLLTSLLSFR